MKHSRQRWQEVNEALANKDDSELWRLVINQDTSQLDITYRGGPLAPADVTGTTTLHPGDRAPDGLCRTSTSSEPARLFDLFRGPHWTVLSFGEVAPAAIPADCWGAPVHSCRIDGHTLVDDSGNIHASYGITGDAVVVIRPDGYIGRTTTPNSLTEGAPLLAV